MRRVLILCCVAACGGKNAPARVTPVSIAAENALPGDPSWDIQIAGGDENFAAYSRPTSLTAGQSVSVQVNVSQPTPITWAVYRLGWYGGTGARKLTEGGPVTVQPQPDPSIDPATGRVECHWSPLFSLEIRSDWPSGVYLSRLQAPDGGARWSYFIVRDDRRADVILVMPTATDQSYNDWGGESLYYDSRFGFPVGHAYQVSYDRPFSADLGAGIVRTSAVPAARYLEANGYDVTYLADHDVQRSPSPLTRAKLVMTVGHDEYWTRAMRDQYEDARGRGINLAYLGANTGYWQIRLDPAGDGLADRLQTGYKEAANLDPIQGPDTTGAFQNMGRPENALLGIMSVDWLMVDFPWVVADASSWLYGGMNVHDGDLFAGVVGVETDGLVDNGDTPSPIDVVGDTPNIGGEKDGLGAQQATVYDTAAGGFVFAAGSIRFPATLAGARGQLGTQRMVRNLIARAGGSPVGPENRVGSLDGMVAPDLTRAAQKVSTLAGSGQAGFADGAALQAQFNSPMGLAVAGDGAVIVADAGNHKIRRIAGGLVTTLADGLGAPWGVAVGGDGVVWVADPGAQKVWQIAAGGTAAAVAGSFGAPGAIAVGPDGRVWVTDLGGAVRVIDGAGAVKVVYPSGGTLSYPTGIWAGDRVYVIDSGNRVLRALAEDGTLSDVAGSQEGGFLDGAGDQARLAPLLGIAPLGGSLLLGDAGNYRVRLVEPGADLKSAVVRTFAGASHLGRDDGPGGQAELVAPSGLAVDAASGVVYIADTGNALIRAATP
jgi:hypothetical protein